MTVYIIVAFNSSSYVGLESVWTSFECADNEVTRLRKILPGYNYVINHREIGIAKHRNSINK